MENRKNYINFRGNLLLLIESIWMDDYGIKQIKFTKSKKKRVIKKFKRPQNFKKELQFLTSKRGTIAYAGPIAYEALIYKYGPESDNFKNKFNAS